jgi:beta-galactosidase
MWAPTSTRFAAISTPGTSPIRFSPFRAAARWSIQVPDVKSSAIGEVFLRIAYEGDVARIYAGDRMVTDDFYHGVPWEIGLRNIPSADLKNGLTLEILRLRQDAPIYLAPGARPAIPDGGQIARLLGVQAVPRYQIVADLSR